MDRRTAMMVLAGMGAASLSQKPDASQTCSIPGTLLLGMGEGACSVKEIVVKWSNLTARVTPQELMEALGGKIEA